METTRWRWRSKIGRYTEVSRMLCGRRRRSRQFNISVLSSIVSLVVVDVIPRDGAASPSHAGPTATRAGRQLTAITMKSVEKTSDPRAAEHLKRTARENTVRRARNREGESDNARTEWTRGREGTAEAGELRWTVTRRAE